jgi:esterase/lipase
MKRSSLIRKLPIAALALGVVLATAAFQSKPVKTKQPTTDTVPERNKKVKDIDDALEELEKSKLEVDRSLKDIDFEKIESEVREATKNLHIDAEKMKVQIDRAMKEVDAAKIQAHVQQSLKEVDAAKIKVELDKAMKEVDLEKIKTEIEASVAKVDWDKINKEMEKVKEIDFQKIETDLKKMRPELEKSMKGAQESIEKARKELTGYKSLIDGLDKDGLINKKEAYTIEYKDGQLTINGKKQTAEVVDKYNSFLKGHENFTIKKEENAFNIKND